MEVYTYQYTPFQMGGQIQSPIKTTIEEYERVFIGLYDHYGILFYNPAKKLWHMAEEQSGAIIGTSKSKARLIKRIRKDVKIGDGNIMEEQVTQGIEECKEAKEVDKNQFFSMFRND